MNLFRILIWCVAMAGAACAAPSIRASEPQTLLYVALPGIRNYLDLGGAGIAVFSVSENYRFVRRIATPASQLEKPENVKGIAACPATGRLYFTTLSRLYCLDLATEQTIWQQAPEGGCDRLAITPDGQWLFVPSLEHEHWNVVRADTGATVKKIVTGGRAHNTICSPDGRYAYLADRDLPRLTVVDVKTLEVVRRVGDFTAPIRPLTVNGAGTRCYVNVDRLLGFEIGDLETGQPLARVEVQGFSLGQPARHGCPSHGVALSPDELEIWVCDAVNRRLHVFDNSQTPPTQATSVALREEPGWVSFSIDARRVYASTGEVIDASTKKIVATLTDEQGRQVHSEKLLEIEWQDGQPLRHADQFGLGRVRRP